MVPFNIIVAVDEKFGIGKDGKLPWHLPADLRHFKEITTKTTLPGKMNAVIMGRKTWDSLPQAFKPFPDRINIVLSRDEDLSLPQGVWKEKSFRRAIDLIIKEDLKDAVEEVFVIGGQEVFRTVVKAVPFYIMKKIYLTRIFKDFECDTSFPREFLSNFEKISETPPATEGDISFTFEEYSKTP